MPFSNCIIRFVECFNLTAHPDSDVAPLGVEFSGAPWGIMETDIGEFSGIMGDIIESQWEGSK